MRWHCWQIGVHDLRSDVLSACSLEELRLERLGHAEHLRAVQRSFDETFARRVLAAEVRLWFSPHPRELCSLL